MSLRGEGVRMERGSANTVVTRAFCITTPAIRSRVHFFPSAGTTAGHYPVSCEVTLFGKGIERRSVRLEGGRLNQPDGIRLEDAFPALDQETSGMCGIEVVFECSQARLNLCNSRLVVEVVSPQFSLAYSAVAFSPIIEPIDESAAATTDVIDDEMIAIAIQDGRMLPSLIVVNPTEELLRPDLVRSVPEGQAALSLGTVAPQSVVEFPLDESLCKNAPHHETLWGSSVVEKLWAGSSWGRDRAACYVLYRDPISKRPTTVCAL